MSQILTLDFGGDKSTEFGELRLTMLHSVAVY